MYQLSQGVRIKCPHFSGAFANCRGRITCMGGEPSRGHIDWGPLKGSTGRAAVGEGCLRRGSHRWKSITKPLGRHTGGPLRPVVTTAVLAFFRTDQNV